MTNCPHDCVIGDIAIFVIFNMTAAAILDFQKFELSKVCPL